MKKKKASSIAPETIITPLDNICPQGIANMGYHNSSIALNLVSYHYESSPSDIDVELIKLLAALDGDVWWWMESEAFLSLPRHRYLLWPGRSAGSG